jgi:hypothetical protein
VWVIQSFYDDHLTQEDEEDYDPMDHVTICHHVEDIQDRIADELSNLWLTPENPSDYPDIMNEMDYFTADRLNTMPTSKYDIVYSYSGIVTVVVYRAYLSI